MAGQNDEIVTSSREEEETEKFCWSNSFLYLILLLLLTLPYYWISTSINHASCYQLRLSFLGYLLNFDFHLSRTESAFKAHGLDRTLYFTERKSDSSLFIVFWFRFTI